MFTTGSKLFFGASALALASAVAYAIATDGALSSAGTLGLLTVSVIFAFLGGVNYANRDGNVSSMDDTAPDTCAAAQRAGVRSAWPAAAALGVAGLVVGAVSKPVVFKVAVVVLLAGIVEWMVLGWSERASDDGEFNANTRRRVMYPLEFPILAAVALGVVVYAFSRIMLRVEPDPGKIIFGLLAALVLVGAFIFTRNRGASKRTVVGVTSLSMLAIFGVGVASAVQGQRTIEEHPTTGSETEVCLEPGVDHHIDEHPTQSVSAKSSVVANIYLQEDGSLVAYVNGYPEQARSEVTVARSIQVNMLFHNESSQPQRLTAKLGSDASETVLCTTAVEEGDQAFLSFKPTRSGVLMVPGLAGAEIRVVVP